MKKLILGLVAMALIGAVGWQVFQKMSLSNQPRARFNRNEAVAVRIEPVRQADIQRLGFYTGSLFARSEFLVVPEISGQLRELFVNIGDKVAAGQLIAQIEDAQFQQQIIEATAELEVARANLDERRTVLENAKREFERFMALHDQHIASQAQLDAARADYKTQQARLSVALAQVSQKEAALRLANLRLDYTRIRLPAHQDQGFQVVGERFVDEGTIVSSSTPIVSVLDIGTLIAVVHVTERDYPMIREGFFVRITTDAFPEKAFEGRVTRIAPLFKETSREARVEIEVPNPENELKPGMFIRAGLMFEEHENATVIPLTALVTKNGGQGIFLADTAANKAKYVRLTLGMTQDGLAEVLAPAIEGQVVTLGQHLLEDGTGIIIETQAVSGNNTGEKRGSAAPHEPEQGAKDRS